MEELKEISVKELKAGEILPDTILWVRTVCAAFCMHSIVVIAQDACETAISLGLHYDHLYRKISNSDLQKAFPTGMLIGIKQPYLKLTLSGNLQLRNDNPENLILEDLDENDITKISQTYVEISNPRTLNEMLTLLYMKNNQEEEAVACIDNLLAINPDNPVRYL